MTASETAGFDEFALDAGGRLRRALVARYGVDEGCDLAADALAYAWEHWDRIRVMDNPVGYLFRVAETSGRRHRRWRRPDPFPPEPLREDTTRTDPDLGRALLRLNAEQRTCVVLVHVFGWSYADVAEVIDAPVSSVRRPRPPGTAQPSPTAGRITMSVDLEERLATYRPTLESAIDAKEVDPAAGRPPLRRRAWIVTAMAAAAVAAGIVGLVVIRPASTPESQPPADGPAPDPPPGFIATTVPAPPPVIAIGDPVMLGAARELSERGIVVDAAVSRQMLDTVPLLEWLRDNDRLGDAFVVHLGTNGPPSDTTLDAFFAPLAEVPQVIVLTAYADRSWIAETNLRLHAAAQRFPNIQILDWASLAEQCPSDCFWEDGYHLTPDGRTYYADLIVAALQP